MSAVFGFGSFAARATASIEKDNKNVCRGCNQPLLINANNTQLICPNCSFVENTDVHEDGTTSKQCIAQTKFIRLFSSKANVDHQKLVYTCKAFQQLLNQNSEYNIQKDLVEHAVELFLTVEEMDGVARSKKEGRKSLFGACIYYKALEHPAGIIWERREIARALGLACDGISTGESKLLKLHCLGRIHLLLTKNTLDLFINKYIETFHIDTRYREFLQNLALVIRKKHVASTSVNKSKAVGIIYWFLQEIGKQIDAKKIKKHCSITKPTFDKVYKAIKKHSDIIGEENLAVPSLV